jgi:hypothetical protein
LQGFHGKGFVTTKEVKGQGLTKLFWRCYSPEEYADISQNARFDDSDTIEHILERVSTEPRKKFDLSERRLLGRADHYSECNLAPLEEVCDFLKLNDSVEQINLSGNYLGCDGALTIAEALAEFAPVLKHVNLSNNELAADGANAIIAALRDSVEKNSFIPISLDVRFNSIPWDVKDPFARWCNDAGISIMI